MDPVFVPCAVEQMFDISVTSHPKTEFYYHESLNGTKFLIGSFIEFEAWESGDLYKGQRLRFRNFTPEIVYDVNCNFVMFCFSLSPSNSDGEPMNHQSERFLDKNITID
jgi:hypothetical protein